ncbi:unnamed protein product [Parajaminaea phylloscopi]
MTPSVCVARRSLSITRFATLPASAAGPSNARRSFRTTASECSAWPAEATISEADAGEASSNAGGSQERRPTRLQQAGPIDRNDAGHSKARGKLEMPKSQTPKSILQLREMKKQRRPIACLTAYDYPSALSLRHADIDVCLVGDSMANVALGHSSTQSLTLDATVHHCQAVHRGLFSPLLAVSPQTPGAPLLIADVPFGTFQTSPEEGVRSAVRLLKEGGADGVKIEGGQEILPLVRRLTKFGIPVMGHLGLQPQRVSSSAGYRLQGRTADEAMEILTDALALQEAGVFSIVLECIPNKVADLISSKLSVPTIGIGAGPETDGQILVTNDMLGEITSPWHVVAGLEAPMSLHEDVGAVDADDPAASADVGDGSAPTTTSRVPRYLPRLHPSAPKGPKFVRNFVAEVTASLHEERASALAQDRNASGSVGNVGIGATRMAAIGAYVDAVRRRSFPDPDREGYKIKSDEWKEFQRRAEAGDI